MNKNIFDSKSLRVGKITYWNLYPLMHELQKMEQEKIKLHSGRPKQINQWLAEGKLDIAPCSSICLLKNPDFEMTLPLGVASYGETLSVFWGLQSEHKELVYYITEKVRELKELFQDAQKIYDYNAREIAKYVFRESQNLQFLRQDKLPPLSFSNASETSNTLSKIFYKLIFGTQNYEFMKAQNFSSLYPEKKGIQLLIGDEALQLKSSFSFCFDLGSVWKQMTGLPFVYAVWQSRGAFLNGWRRKILEAGHRAEQKMQTEPSYYMPEHCPLDKKGKNIDLAKYWRSIYYRLGADELRGLTTFLCLARELSTKPLNNTTMAKIIRWQELSKSKQTISL